MCKTRMSCLQKHRFLCIIYTAFHFICLSLFWMSSAVLSSQARIYSISSWTVLHLNSFRIFVIELVSMHFIRPFYLFFCNIYFICSFFQNNSQIQTDCPLSPTDCPLSPLSSEDCTLALGESSFLFHRKYWWRKLIFCQIDHILTFNKLKLMILLIFLF